MDANEQAGRVTIAIAKGRVLSEALPLLASVGIELNEDPNESRRLILDTNNPAFSIVVVRSADVPTYVEFGAADLGIVGKDVLMESESQELYELLDLDIAPCRMVLAAEADVSDARKATGATTSDVSRSMPRHVRVASKYPITARRYFNERGIQAEVIHLYGSMELAPRVGLSEYIVDLVDSGRTLQANRLVELESICPITTRLIANKTASKLKRALIDPLVAQLRAHCAVHGREIG